MLKSKITNCPHLKIVELYNSILGDALPKVKPELWKGTRRIRLVSRWKEDPGRQSLSWWNIYFNRIKSYPFLLGNNDRRWTADLDWILKSSNMAKILEGRYVEKKKRPLQPRSISEAQSMMNEDIARELNEIAERGETTTSKKNGNKTGPVCNSGMELEI
ncbi:MAG: hypothetical protein DRH10_00625 [Deltaproteobacteria bacterium]|nr:MAG: hypothetical protein DRH10_00625 [Deltaproteobacteria bacterium]